MNCPYCNKEMKEGYLHTPSYLLFSPKKRKHTMYIHKEKGEFHLIQDPAMGSYRLSSKKAYHCPDCNKVEIDLNEPE